MAEIGEGSVIGNYRVIRLLGQGGMGIMYDLTAERGVLYNLRVPLMMGCDAM